MNQINIITAQNVTLRIELANIGDRFLAALIDMLIKMGVLLSIALLTFLFREASGNKVLNVTLWSVCIIFLVFYSLMFEYFMKGQTPGKRAMKIKVARLVGEQVTFGNLILRWLFRIIDFPLSWPAIGISTIIFTKKYQRLGDVVAGTVLITTKERTSLEDTSYSQLESNYKPSFPQVNQLSGRDAEVIKKVIRLYTESDKYELVMVAAEKLRMVLDVHPNMDDLSFLKVVLQDYNYAEASTAQTDFQTAQF